MSRFIVAIDQGTTSTRCMIFDRSGPVASAQIEHRQIFPRPGWVEHDASEIWRNTQKVISEAIQSVGAKAGDIAAVGITNQRETTVVWDRKTGKPLANAIVWQDTRTKTICDELARDAGIDRFRAKTGLPLATYFSGPKLRWLLENDSSLRAAAKQGDALFGTIDSWLIWNLTGGNHVTDVTNASRTMLMDLKSLTWDDGLIDLMEIEPRMLPRIVPSMDATSFGKTLKDGPFGDAIPIAGCLGDQQAAMVGQCCFNPGESKNTYGTGCFLLANTGLEPVVSRKGLISTVAYQRAYQPARYALEGSIAMAGSLVQWLRDNLGMIRNSSEIEELARGTDNSGGAYIVPAFSGLFAPYWRSDARGIIAGLTGFTNKHHLARAVLEATAFQTRDVVDAMQEDSGTTLTQMKVDGGMTTNDLLMQFQADVLGIPVIRNGIRETTALGAAYAAGLAVYFWKDEAELRKQWREDKRWEASMNDADRSERMTGWHKAVERAMGWVTT